MGGIRELAMGKDPEEEKPTYPRPYTPKFEYPDGGLLHTPAKISYEQFDRELSDDITISFFVDGKEADIVTDYNDRDYNWNEADIAVREIAYDKTKAMIANFETAYTSEIDVNDLYDGTFEIIVTLTPNK